MRDVFEELVDGDGDDVIGFETRVICGDGSVHWVQWNTRTVPERGIVFAAGRDVTDRRRADAELREAQRSVGLRRVRWHAHTRAVRRRQEDQVDK